MIMATEDSKGAGWIQCDRCDAYFRPTAMTSEDRTDKTIYHYVCPECGYHGTDEIIHEGQNKEEIDMNNYYTIANAASRLNVSRNTVNRAIHNGIFTDVELDRSTPGAPAYMIPSNQVEYYVSHGGILKRRSSKTGQKSAAEAKRDENHPYYDSLSSAVVRAQEAAVKEAQDAVNKELEKRGTVTYTEVAEKLGIPAADPGKEAGWTMNDRIPLYPMPKPVEPNKITIEIDASMIEKQISQRFRDQVAQVRAAIALVEDELAKLEAML